MPEDSKFIISSLSRFCSSVLLILRTGAVRWRFMNIVQSKVIAADIAKDTIKRCTSVEYMLSASAFSEIEIIAHLLYLYGESAL